MPEKKMFKVTNLTLNIFKEIEFKEKRIMYKDFKELIYRAFSASPFVEMKIYKQNASNNKVLLENYESKSIVDLDSEFFVEFSQPPTFFSDETPNELVEKYNNVYGNNNKTRVLFKLPEKYLEKTISEIKIGDIFSNIAFSTNNNKDTISDTFYHEYNISVSVRCIDSPEFFSINLDAATTGSEIRDKLKELDKNNDVGSVFMKFDKKIVELEDEKYYFTSNLKEILYTHMKPKSPIIEYNRNKTFYEVSNIFSDSEKCSTFAIDIASILYDSNEACQKVAESSSVTPKSTYIAIINLNERYEKIDKEHNNIIEKFVEEVYGEIDKDDEKRSRLRKEGLPFFLSILNEKLGRNIKDKVSEIVEKIKVDEENLLEFILNPYDQCQQFNELSPEEQLQFRKEVILKNSNAISYEGLKVAFDFFDLDSSTVTEENKKQKILELVDFMEQV